jgi:predicted nucleic acid-binding Zn ribbon protein
VRSLGIEKKVKQNEALIRWSEIVGEQVSQVTRVDRVQDGILLVKVSSSAWRNELVYMKKDILERIYSSIGKGVIEDIRFI